MIRDRGIDGDVAARMDAYRGNQQGLMQRYSQSQELIDLLALQKLKSEKEAAARDMQMKMAQQQAAQGQPATIKEQREQEVMGMTKQEIAQQMGGIAQQRQQEQQKKMQQLMQAGVATLPAPGMARMAGGGIVAFAGEDGSYVEGEEDEDEDERRRRLTRRGYRGAREEEEAPIEDRRLTRRGFRPAPQPAGIAAVPVAPRTIPAPAAEDRTALNVADAALRTAPAGVAAALPKPPVAPVPGTLAAPTTPTAPPLNKDMQGLGALVAKTSAEMMQRDPRAEAQTEESRVESRLRLTPEQRAMLEGNAEQLRRLYAEEMDPEARRRRELIAFLRGAGGRSTFGSVMGGAAAASEAERRRGFRESVKGTELVQKKLEDIIGADRGAVKEGIGAGQKAFEQGSISQREGLAQGRAQYGTELESRDRALDREIRAEANRLQAQTNAALQDVNNNARLQNTLKEVNNAIEVTAFKYAKVYDDKIAGKEMMLQGAKGEDAKKLKSEIDALIRERDAVIEQRTDALIQQRDALLATMSSSAGGSGFTVRKKQ
jgi:hypothetical protein